MNPAFTGSRLDRVDHLRSDVAAVAAMAGDWRARVLALDGLAPRFGGDGRLAWMSIADVAPDAETVLLGCDEGGCPHFAVVPVSAESSAMRNPAMFRALAMLDADDAAVFGTALSLIVWHNSHRFCARCGAATRLFRGGWGRQCGSCGADHFPRTDPVVIMLAEHDGRALVGRQSRFPPGNYSALAGFLEPGESIEEAVRREVFEEAGVRCGAVRYQASQPWPFGGSQLMIGCIAEALDDALRIDTTELEDAKWVTRDDARLALAGDSDASFKAPPPFAIAHTLLQMWVEPEL